MGHTTFSKREKTYIVTGMETAGDVPVQVRKARRFFHWGKVSAILTLAAMAFAVVGFFAFSTLVNGNGNGDAAGIPRADAIVVLTGGEARIPEAVKLLAQGKGKRLLISGVNPITTRAELASLTPHSQELFRCCIDVDKVASDTIGNANETRSWAEKRRFKSLIVVTASYHMPRSLAELRRALPDVEFIPYPVKPRNLRMEAWWTHAATFQLMATEYVKFVPAYGRCLIIEAARQHSFSGGARHCLNLQSAE